MGALSLRLDGTLNPGCRIMAGLRTYPHPPFCRNLPSYKSIIRPGVWKLRATVPYESNKFSIDFQLSQRVWNDNLPIGTPEFQNSNGLKLLESTRLPLGKTRSNERWTISVQIPWLLACNREAALSLSEYPHCWSASAINASCRISC